MPSPQSVILETLRLVPWITAADPALMAELAGQSRLVALSNKESLARRGAPLSHLVVVAGGQLEVNMSTASGKLHVVGYLGRGLVFGLIQVLDESAACHNAEARGPASVVLVPRDAILAGFQRSPAMMLGAIKVLCQRSRLLYESLADQSLLSTTARVAHQLILLATAYGDRGPSDGGRLNIELSQSSLGDLLGLSRQSLNAELKKLERLGFLKMAYAHIELVDMAGLEALVERES